MIDYLVLTRQNMIDNLQASLRSVRNLMGYSINDIAEIIGVTRQTINNLETGKSKLTATQYIAYAAIIDNFTETNNSMYKAVENIIDGQRSNNYNSSFANLSLLKRWFLCFENDDNDHLLPINKQNLTPQILNSIARNYKVFVDHTSLMNENARDVLGEFSNVFSKENAKFILPVKVIEEIQHYLSDPELKEQAINALKLTTELQRQNTIDLRGETSDTNVRGTILSVFAKFRSLHRLLLLTQYEEFAQEILNLNKNSHGFRIVVGFLVDKTVHFYSENNPMSDCGNILSVEDTFFPENGVNKDAMSIDMNDSLISWSNL
jgi:DNA-binding XRE family transcriptional regulator